MTYPGMGETKYIYQAETLFNILEKLLPAEDTIVKQCITTLLGSSHDGFKLLHIIFGKTVPVFCLYSKRTSKMARPSRRCSNGQTVEIAFPS
jgi:hypothetical protein